MMPLEDAISLLGRRLSLLRREVRRPALPISSEGNANIMRSNFFQYSALLSVVAASVAHAAQIRGAVADSLGSVISQAHVELLQNGKLVGTTTADSEGKFSFDFKDDGRYQVHVTATTFADYVSEGMYLAGSQTAQMRIVMNTGKLVQQVTVTADGTPTYLSQTGSAVTVISGAQFEQTRDIQEVLRQAPGVQATQTGQAGATAGIFIRGGNKETSKVLIDGVSVSDIGGAVDFSNLASVGVAKAEVQRGPNSALYGSDAMSGVVNITTRRGATSLPQLSYLGEGGNFGTYHQEGALSGAYKQYDYFSDYSRYDSANNIKNNQYHNGSFVGNYGWKVLPGTELRGNIRYIVSSYGAPNAIELYGIPDSAQQKDQTTLIAGAIDNQATANWHNLVRYSALRLNGKYTAFGPTGLPFVDSYSGGIGGYLGAPMTIKGANGYTVRGQAIFQYVEDYPNLFVTHTSKDALYAQSDYTFNPHLVALGAFRYEDERGYTASTGYSQSSTSRGNYTYTMNVKGDFLSRVYYSVGSGIDNNAVYGVEATPRASLAYYAFSPRSSSWLNGTKLRFSFGKGVKEPSISNQNSSLYSALQKASGGADLIAQYHVQPMGAERSRNYDGGIDQQLFHGRGKIGITYFHNQFSNVVEYVPKAALIGSLGIPAAVAKMGAYVNSQAYRAQGAEAEIEYQINSRLLAKGGYTYLDAVVQRSFSSSALSPASNPQFPNIKIGWFSPLAGARPFRRAPHSGYLNLLYSQARWSASLTGTLVGRRDDSDFLYDVNYGPTLLLPNRNLLGSYQKFDLAGSYQVNRFLSLTTSMQNLLSQHYDEAFGYRALPFTFRTGMKFTFGGEAWGRK